MNKDPLPYLQYEELTGTFFFFFARLFAIRNTEELYKSVLRIRDVLSLIWILTFLHSGSRIRTFFIPDHGYRKKRDKK
jgi:hypothetical protein